MSPFLSTALPLSGEPRPVVCLLEWRPDVRDRLSAALAREGVFLAVTSRDEHALRAILPLLPRSVCLVGGGGSREFLRWIQRDVPGARAVVLGQQGRLMAAAEARALGATWVDAHRASPAHLAELVRGAVAHGPRAGEGSAVLARLSPREREVLAHVASGADNLTIAACLDITERTVRAHVSALYLKVGGENRAQLALRGRELGA